MGTGTVLSSGRLSQHFYSFEGKIDDRPVKLRVTGSWGACGVGSPYRKPFNVPWWKAVDGWIIK